MENTGDKTEIKNHLVVGLSRSIKNESVTKAFYYKGRISVKDVLISGKGNFCVSYVQINHQHFSIIIVIIIANSAIIFIPYKINILSVLLLVLRGC